VKRLVIAVVSVLVTLVACSDSSTTGRNSSCAGGPVLRLPDHENIRLASCAGEIGLAGPGPAAATLEVGQQAMLSPLGFGYSTPVSDDQQVVDVRVNGNSADIRAVGAGATTVSLATRFCMGRSSGRCPAIRVTVLSR
jgi:hypothetical protein